MTETEGHAMAQGDAGTLDTPDDGDAGDGFSPVQSVDRAARILQLLVDDPQLGVSEISRRLGVHRSTAFRLLGTLEAHNLVEQESHRGLYRLGFGVLGLAGAVTSRIDLVRDAQPVCDRTEDRFEETANVTVLDGAAAVNIAQTMSRRRIAVLRHYVGQRTPLHATSTGKVLLAYAPSSLREQVLGASLKRYTDTTIVEASVLRAELDSVRERGWAAAEGEWELETNAVAVPVRGPSGGVVAALAVTAPDFRMPPESFVDFVAGLTDEALELARRVGHLPENAVDSVSGSRPASVPASKSAS